MTNEQAEVRYAKGLNVEIRMHKVHEHGKQNWKKTNKGIEIDGALTLLHQAYKNRKRENERPSEFAQLSEQSITVCLASQGNE